jgi:hypothetical protein
MLSGEEEFEWVAMAHEHGSFCINALLRAVERGSDSLPVDPVAWENTMAAVEWTLTLHVIGRVYAGATVTEADVEQARRLRLLGSEALNGKPRSPELLPLAERCLVLLSGPDWRRALALYPEAFHVTYPPSEEA